MAEEASHADGSELDRLTIDDSGRFYWDGKLVSYDTQQKQLTNPNANSLDHSMGIIDRATYELGGHKTPATIEGELAPAEALLAHGERAPALDLDAVRAEVAAALAEAIPATPVMTTIEQRYLTLSGWQKFGAFIVILGIAVSAVGMATYGYVAARDWGCKTGVFQKGCPAEKAAPQRPDIPGVANQSPGPVVHRGTHPLGARAFTSACDAGNMGRYRLLSAIVNAQLRKTDSAPQAETESDSQRPDSPGSDTSAGDSKARDLDDHIFDLLPPKPAESSGPQEPGPQQPKPPQAEPQETGLQETGLQETGLQETGLQETGLQETWLHEPEPQGRIRST